MYDLAKNEYLFQSSNYKIPNIYISSLKRQFQVGIQQNQKNYFTSEPQYTSWVIAPK